ncbi:MAG: FHA domain-containing protein [Saccharofermentans sp.]|nr:FHA domain-containing protein [Saccharofermentans sp.]
MLLYQCVQNLMSTALISFFKINAMFNEPLNTIPVNGGTGGSTDSVDGGSSVNWLVIAMVVTAVIIVAVVVFLIVKKTTKKSVGISKNDIGTIPNIADNNRYNYEEYNHYINLVDLNNTRNQYSVLINDRITLGKSGCSVSFPDDLLLSNVQCEIKRRGQLYSIKDLNSLNGTKYDYMMVYGDTPVITGGIIEIGHQKLRIEFVDRKPPVVVNLKNGQGKTILSNRFTVGLLSDNSFVVNSKYVSKNHAEIISREGKYYVRDLNSKNGTYIDNRRLQGSELIELFDGTRIRIADVDLLFKFEKKD